MTWIKAGNQKWYCDGTADDVQLQAAVDSLSSGGKVTLSVGNFYIDAAVTLPSNILIEGSDEYATALTQNTINTNIFTSSGSPSEYVGIRNLRFRGKKDTNPTDTGCFVTGKFRYSRFENLRGYRGGSGIVIEDVGDTVDCWDNVILSCDFWQFVSYALKFGTRGTDQQVLGGHFTQAGTAGLYTTSGGHKIIGVTIDQNAINVLFEAGGSTRIESCNLDQADKENIYIKATSAGYCRLINIVGNSLTRASKLTDNTYSHIKIEGYGSGETTMARDIVIANNVFMRYTTTGGGMSKACIELAGVNEAYNLSSHNNMRAGYYQYPVIGVGSEYNLIQDGDLV